jgi:chromosome partitioning protein
MLTVAIASLSGGQGKTTLSLLLGRYLAAQTIRTLLIDANPLMDLTTYAGIELQPGQPNFTSVLEGKAELAQSVYSVAESELLLILPSDLTLTDLAAHWTRNQVKTAGLFRQKLPENWSQASVCLIDTPPQRSLLNQIILEGVDGLIIPVETSVKGYASLIHTLDWFEHLNQIGGRHQVLYGVVPFRDRWVGSRQSQESRKALIAMQEEVGKELILPSIRESEACKRILNQRLELGQLKGQERDRLEQTLKDLCDRIQINPGKDQP